MEDYSPTPDEVEETPLKKRRFLRGNFLRSWLEKRDNDEDETGEEKSGASKDDKEQDWRPQRFMDRLSKIFNSLVGLENVREQTSEQAQPNEAIQSEATAAIDHAEEEFEGLLAVSPDAQMRYYGYELMDEPGVDEEEPVAMAASHERAESSYPELANTIAHEQRSARTAMEPTTGSTEQIGEVLRRRKTDRLERRVKKLKKQTKSLKREQAELKHRQKDFEEELAKKQHAQERFEKVTVPNMEKARQRLQQRLETVSPARTEGVPKLEVKTEAKTEAKHKPQVDFEYNKQTAELPQNHLNQSESQEKPSKILMERDFERKHEVKDRAGYTQTLNRGVAGYQSRQMPSRPYYQINQPSSNSNNFNQVVPNNMSYQPGTSMYKQAMKTGFWSGLALTIILLIVLILMN